MSQSTPEKDKAAKTPAKEKKSRSPIERMIVWVVILGLAVLVGNEYMTKQAYQKDLDLVNAALDRSTPEKQVSFEEIRGQISKEPVVTDTNYGGVPAKLHSWSWRGMKEYRIDLIVSKETGNIMMLKPAGE